ncbi:MAG: hypothetical protein K8R39_07035 [Arcobacteraceae bacterium]|nr:hypothetical protein [Arcobacteraceae bacterium]
MENEYLFTLIDKEQEHLRKDDLSSSAKSNHINNIIRIKKSIYTGENYEKQIYNDLKNWIKYYIISCDENNFGYDVFDKDIIVKMLNLVSYTQQILLYNFIIRQLKINSHTNDKIIWCESKIKKIEIFLLLTSCNPIDIIKSIFLISSYNVITLLISSFIFLIFVNIIFLPKEYLGINIFQITYEIYYKDNFLLNHILNVTNYFFNFSNGNFKIILENIYDLVLLLSLKIVFYLIIINFIIKEISRSVRKYD